MEAVAAEVPPVMVSPISNFCWLEMNSRVFSKSSTRTSAVALEVPPVIVSPTTNLPVVPSPLSVTSLFPSSFSKYCVSVLRTNGRIEGIR